ncbi:GTP cyclohydrolase I FolE [Microbacterium sp. STN6]|uniref:GTP cyclohydrolase I FolE n=1 Tax=Microbacterium sp. STN6 TaxID=2995588 RepID=UPI002260DA10|nr:GTP cyclohydrolase I FolE [Microbacterium sp. STN6]MCX7523058.1 GTP cyclohydrolase I FolE [Microbacterium sp. STN6]
MGGVDRERIQRAVSELLLAIGEDPSRPGLASTPERVADAYAEFFDGLGRDPLALLSDSVPAGEHDTEAVVVRGIAFRSVCEHHLLPFLGTAHVAYLPGERVVGLGRLARVVETLAARPQLQERLTEEIADTLQHGLGARGVLVVLDAVHGCVVARGSRQTGSSTVTVASRGDLTDPAARAEIMALMSSGGSER